METPLAADTVVGVAGERMYLFADPAIVVIAGAVPAIAVLSVAVTKCVVDVLAVVNVTVAVPAAFVVDVGAPKDPPPVLDQVITLPAVATLLPFASESCAVIVTELPATGVELGLAWTTYWVAG